MKITESEVGIREIYSLRRNMQRVARCSWLLRCGAIGPLRRCPDVGLVEWRHSWRGPFVAAFLRYRSPRETSRQKNKKIINIKLANKCKPPTAQQFARQQLMTQLPRAFPDRGASVTTAKRQNGAGDGGRNAPPLPPFSTRPAHSRCRQHLDPDTRGTLPKCNSGKGACS